MLLYSLYLTIIKKKRKNNSENLYDFVKNSQNNNTTILVY